MTYNPGGGSGVPNLDGMGIVTSGGPQSLVNGVMTVVTGFWTAQWDDATFFNLGTQTVTIPATGRYLLTGTCAFAANSTGERRLFIRKGTGTFLASATAEAPASRDYVSVSQQAELTAADTVEMRVDQNSGGALNIDIAYLQVTRINA